METTSVTLGTHFEEFIKTKISQGRYHNASEVIRAGLRLLEEDENHVLALRNAIEEGRNSGIALDFDPEQHLQSLKAEKSNG
ncbi:MAG: type II toxin-antitoxin system ParD family antitoxin [Bacteroides sp.]|nr:type II toxin-antitoxin system ParD family antitoxin [Bacteroides sp.]